MPTPIQDFFHRLGPESRILLVRLRSMGDCLLLTAPLRSLKRRFPGFRLSVLVEERFEGCFSRNPDLVEVLAVGPGKLASLAALHRKKFDAVINLHGGPTSLLFARTVRGTRIGIEGFQYGFLYSGLVPRGETAMHAVEKTLEWLQWLGLDPSDPLPLRYADHPEEARRMLERTGEGPYVVIHPGALTATKRWSSDGFAQVGASLRDAGYRQVVTAGPGEEMLATELSSRLPGSLLMLGLTIPELGELIRGADLYLGNDSGPMHLAAAVGTPTVAVWGSSNSVQWRPWQVPHRVVQNPFDCNPCAGYRCEVAPTPLCIESVSPAQVLAAAGELFEETGPTARPRTDPVYRR